MAGREWSFLLYRHTIRRHAAGQAICRARKRLARCKLLHILSRAHKYDYYTDFILRLARTLTGAHHTNTPNHTVSGEML